MGAAHAARKVAAEAQFVSARTCSSYTLGQPAKLLRHFALRGPADEPLQLHVDACCWCRGP
jgi:hypothetical protein